MNATVKVQVFTGLVEATDEILPSQQPEFLCHMSAADICILYVKAKARKQACSKPYDPF